MYIKMHTNSDDNNINNKSIQILLLDDEKQIESEVISTILTLYKFDKYISNKNNYPSNIYFYHKLKNKKNIVNNSIIIANNVNVVRNLGNEPPNILNPKTFSNFIYNESKNNKYTVEILNYTKLKN